MERQAEQAENEAKIKEQKDKYEANLLLLEDKFKEVNIQGRELISTHTATTTNINTWHWFP